MKSILIVEDEFLIALDLQSELEAAGYRVIGPCGSVEEAQSLIALSLPDAAVLDLNLRGETSLPLAEDLAQRGIPHLFLSGNDISDCAAQTGASAALVKPVNYAELARHLANMLPATSADA